MLNDLTRISVIDKSFALNAAKNLKKCIRICHLSRILLIRIVGRSIKTPPTRHMHSSLGKALPAFVPAVWLAAARLKPGIKLAENLLINE